MQGSAHPPDWPAIDTVLLDMDGTLLDLGYDQQFWEEQLPRRFAASRGVTLEEARRLMRPIFESTAGTLDWYCIDYWSRALGLDIVSLKRATRHHIDWLPRAREFLGSVRQAGKRVALVTNAHPEILAIKDAPQMLDGDYRLRLSIRLRNPYVDPISLLQVDLLRRWRDGGRGDEALLEALATHLQRKRIPRVDCNLMAAELKAATGRVSVPESNGAAAPVAAPAAAPAAARPAPANATI